MKSDRKQTDLNDLESLLVLGVLGKELEEWTEQRSAWKEEMRKKGVRTGARVEVSSLRAYRNEAHAVRHIEQGGLRRVVGLACSNSGSLTLDMMDG